MLDDAMVVDKDDLNLYFPPDTSNYSANAASNCHYDPNYSMNYSSSSSANSFLHRSYQYSYTTAIGSLQFNSKENLI